MNNNKINSFIVFIVIKRRNKFFHEHIKWVFPKAYLTQPIYRCPYKQPQSGLCQLMWSASLIFKFKLLSASSKIEKHSLQNEVKQSSLFSCKCLKMCEFLSG